MTQTSKTRIRQLFNASQYPAMIENGELEVEALRDSHLKRKHHGEEPCTRSQTLRFKDAEGRWIVEVHQYLRQDGTIGASGQPDPKRMRHQGRILLAK